MPFDFVSLNLDSKAVEPLVVLALAAGAGYLVWRSIQAGAANAADSNAGLPDYLTNAGAGVGAGGGSATGGAVIITGNPTPSTGTGSPAAGLGPSTGGTATQGAALGGGWASFWPSQGSGHP